MRNLGSLKNRLSKLAVGEYVMWSSPYPELTLPPDAILQDVKAHAISQQIKLVIAEWSLTTQSRRRPDEY